MDHGSTGAIAMNWWDDIPFIDLTGVTIPAAVIDFVPESVARENTILPLTYQDGAIEIVTADPTDFDTMQKLQFMLNKDLRPVRVVPRADRRRDQPALRPRLGIAGNITGENNRRMEQTVHDPRQQRCGLPHRLFHFCAHDSCCRITHVVNI
jgi:hypothetical protein